MIYFQLKMIYFQGEGLKMNIAFNKLTKMILLLTIQIEYKTDGD